jgi:hypothetical protein
MEKNAELLRLEGFVDKLLTKYNQLKANYLALQETLQERDIECVNLKNSLSQLHNERLEVGNRVAGLLDRIEQWELEQGSTQVAQNTPPNTMQASLFNVDVEDKDN